MYTDMRQADYLWTTMYSIIIIIQYYTTYVNVLSKIAK